MKYVVKTKISSRTFYDLASAEAYYSASVRVLGGATLYEVDILGNAKVLKSSDIICGGGICQQ